MAHYEVTGLLTGATADASSPSSGAWRDSDISRLAGKMWRSHKGKICGCATLVGLFGAVLIFTMLHLAARSKSYAAVQTDASFSPEFRACRSATQDIAGLRMLSWPAAEVRQAPTLTRLIYINLASSKARREYMETQFDTFRERGVNINVTRLDAVNASVARNSPKFEKLRNNGFSETRVPNVTGKWKIAACEFSHYTAIAMLQGAEEKRMLANNEVTVIAEDDAEFAENFVELWQELWPYVPDEWDLLHVGWFGTNDNCVNRVNIHVDRADWRMDPVDMSCSYGGNQAYIVRPGRVSQVLRRFEDSHMTHADALLGAPTPDLEDPLKVPELKIYVTMPMLAVTHQGLWGEAFKSDRLA